MGCPERVRVAGPLAPFAEGFGARLKGLGYSRFTVEAQLQLMAHVSAWLDDRGLGADQLTTARGEEYLVYRRACGHGHRCSSRALWPLLTYLRGVGGRAARDRSADRDRQRSAARRVRGVPGL